MLSQPSNDFPQVDWSDDEASRDRSPPPPIALTGMPESGDRPNSEIDRAAMPYLRAFFEEAMDAMAIADDSGCYIG